MPGFWLWLVGLFAGAFALRLAVAGALAETVLFRSPQLDPHEFLTWARSIAAGNPIWIPSHAPGYPFFLGSVLEILDGSLAGARAVQAALGGVVCVVVALLGRRWFGAWSGLAAGALVALQGPLIFVEVSFLAEGLFVLLLMTALFALARIRSGHWSGAVSGLLLGLATVVRATGLLFVPAFALALWLRRSDGGTASWKTRVGAVAALALTWALVVVPVARGFGQRFEVPFFLQGFGGLNILMGNHPEHEGVPYARLGETWDEVAGEAYREGARSVADRESYYLGKALELTRENPLGVLRGLARKAVWLTQAEEVRETHSYYFFRQRSALLGLLPGFGLIFALGVAGLGMAVRERRLAWGLGAYLAATVASCILIIMSSRYRLPLVPALAIPAGWTLFRLLSWAREKRWRSLGGLLAACLVLFGLSHLWRHEPSRGFAEELGLTASSLERDGKLAEAESTYREALRLEPGAEYSWTGLGRTLQRQGRPNEAEDAFRRAIAAGPGYAKAHGGLGALLWQQGRRSEALKAYQEAHRIAPDTPTIGRDLGRLLLELGRLEEARTVFETMVHFDRNDARSLQALARIAGALGEPARGLEPARRAASLDGGNPEALIVLAMVATAAGEADEAARAIESAARLVGEGDPRVRFARALWLRAAGETERAQALLERLRGDFPDFNPAQALGGSPGA